MAINWEKAGWEERTAFLHRWIVAKREEAFEDCPELINFLIEFLEMQLASPNINAIPPETFKRKMQEIDKEYGWNYPDFHIVGDKLLLEVLTSLGYGEGCKIFDAKDKGFK